jgi:hypothetical protein
MSKNDDNTKDQDRHAPYRYGPGYSPWASFEEELAWWAAPLQHWDGWLPDGRRIERSSAGWEIIDEEADPPTRCIVDSAVAVNVVQLAFSGPLTPRVGIALALARDALGRLEAQATEQRPDGDGAEPPTDDGLAN